MHVTLSYASYISAHVVDSTCAFVKFLIWNTGWSQLGQVSLTSALKVSPHSQVRAKFDNLSRNVSVDCFFFFFSHFTETAFYFRVFKGCLFVHFVRGLIGNKHGLQMRPDAEPFILHLTHIQTHTQPCSHWRTLTCTYNHFKQMFFFPLHSSFPFFFSFHPHHLFKPNKTVVNTGCQRGKWNASEAYTDFGLLWQTVHPVFDSSLGPASLLHCGGPFMAFPISHTGIRGMGGIEEKVKKRGGGVLRSGV